MPPSTAPESADQKLAAASWSGRHLNWPPGQRAHLPGRVTGLAAVQAVAEASSAARAMKGAARRSVANVVISWRFFGIIARRENSLTLRVRPALAAAGILGAVLAVSGDRQGQIALWAVPLTGDVRSPALRRPYPARGHLRGECRFSATCRKDRSAQLVAAKPLPGGMHIKIPGRLAPVVL